MRVLHIYSGNLFGGVETFLIALAKQHHLCPTMSHDFLISYQGRLSRELKSAGADVFIAGGARLSRPWSVWLARRRAKKHILAKEFNICVFHSFWPLVVFGPVIMRKKIPIVLWCHDIPRGNHWLERWALKRPVQFIIANSQVTRDAVLRVFPGIPCQVVRYIVGFPVIKDSQKSREEIRRQLHTSLESVVIVQISRLERWKGHKVLLEALARISDIKEWECWIVGGAQRPKEVRYMQELKDVAYKLGILERVHFLGQRSDIPEVLNVADIFCQPNTAPEPFGLVFIEALAAGLPVVTSAIGGALEIIDSSSGKLVEPNSPEALSEVLRFLIIHPEERRLLGKNGLSRAKMLCDPLTQLNQLYAILSKVLSGKIE